MKHDFRRFLIVLCALLTSLVLAAGCALAEEADVAAQLTLNPTSDTVKAEVTVKTYVDGDTVHFHVPEAVSESGVLKARFLAINTPEISGKVEEYGKAAAEFTRQRLSGAVSILIESDDGRWNLDSTGDRHLVWVWYKSAESEPYRCLNVEILQNGLAKANATANNRYGTIASAALDYAKEQKLGIYSGQPDPDFYYGDAIELTLRELRTHAADYVGKKVAFSGIVTLNDENSVFVEDFDEDTGLTFGMTAYYGHGLSGKGLTILKPGNEVRIVGTMQYYETGGTYQVSDLNYRMMKPDDPGNIQMLSEGHAPAYVPMDAATFAGESVIDGVSYPNALLALSSSVSMEGLFVEDGYQSGDSGEITLFCRQNDTQVQLRTAALTMEDGTPAAVEDFLNKTLNVKGIADVFDGAYQVKVFSMNAITIAE